MFFSGGLCSVIPNQKPFMLSVMFGSFLSPFSTESWLILKALQQIILCFVCSLLRQTLGCSSCCSSLLPLWVTSHRYQGTTRESAPLQRTLHFISNCENVLGKDSHPGVGAVAQVHSGPALSLPNVWLISGASLHRGFTLCLTFCASSHHPFSVITCAH